MPAINPNTVLALSFQNKTAGTKEIRDYGAIGYVTTQINTATLSTAVTPPTGFGKTSLYLDGDSDTLNIGATANWKFLSDGSSWTCEFRFRDNATGYLGGFLNTTLEGGSNKYGLGIYRHTDDKLYCVIMRGVAGQPAISTASTFTIPNDNAFHTYMVTFDGSSVTFFQDGTKANTVALDYACANTNPTSAYLEVGAFNASAGTFLSGYLTEIRISNSVRQTANYSVATAPYGSDSNTNLLLHMDSYDVNFTPKIPKFIGSAQITTTSPKFGESSVLFNGSTDYINIPDSADFNLGSGDFTLNASINIQAGQEASTMTIFGMANSVSDAFWFYYDNNKLSFYCGNVGGTPVPAMQRAWTPTAGVWYQVRLVRVGNTTAIYVDDAKLGADDTSSYTCSDYADCVIGVNPWSGASFYWVGKMNDIYLVKGTGIAPTSTTILTPPYRQYYSRGSSASAPTTNDNLSTIYSQEELFQVKLVDSIDVNQTANVPLHAIHIFKDVLTPASMGSYTWTGQSTLAPSTTIVYFDIWNVNDSQWDNLDEENDAGANTNFTFTGSQTLANYKTTDNEVVFRVRQQSS